MALLDYMKEFQDQRRETKRRLNGWSQNLKRLLKRDFKNVKLIETIEFSKSTQTNTMIRNHVRYYRNILIEMCNRYVGKIILFTYFASLLIPSIKTRGIDREDNVLWQVTLRNIWGEVDVTLENFDFIKTPYKVQPKVMQW